MRTLESWVSADYSNPAQINLFCSNHPNMLQGVRVGIVLPEARGLIACLLARIYLLAGSRFRFETKWLEVLRPWADQFHHRADFGLAYGHFLRLGGQQETAYRYLEMALAGADGTVWQLPIMIELADCAASLNDLNLAVEQGHKGLLIARTLDDKRQCARVLNSLGLWMQRVGSYADANAHFDEAYQIERKLGEPLRISRVLNNWAVLALQQGNLARAFKRYDDARYFLHPNAHTHDYIRLLLNIGVIYFEWEQFEQAENLFEEAIARVRQGYGWYGNEAQAHTNLGAVLQATGRFEAALSATESAIALWQRSGNELNLCRALINLAELRLDMKRYGLFEPSWVEAKDLLEKYQVEPAAQSMLNEAANLWERYSAETEFGRNSVSFV